MLLVANGFVEQPATELFTRHNRALFNFWPGCAKAN